MHRDDAHLVADGDRIAERRVMDDRMFIKDLCNVRLRPVVERALARRGADPLGAGLHRQALRADVEDGALRRRAADDRDEHGGRATIQRADGMALRGVHQRIRAGAKLCNAGQNTKQP